MCLIPFIIYTLIERNLYRSELYAPTGIYKIQDTYFITDCWHGRVIYSDDINKDISEWKTLTDNVTGVHNIAGFKDKIICDDTEGAKLLVFTKNGNQFNHTQTIDGITDRPHCISYDSITNSFYCLCALSGTVITLQEHKDKIIISHKESLDCLSGHYTRSFSIIDSLMYFVSGRDQLKPLISVVDYLHDFRLVKQYNVPEEISGMNYLCKLGNRYYMTIYTDSQAKTISPNIIYTDCLDSLQFGNYTSCYEDLHFNGVPYYVSFFNNKAYIAEIHYHNGISEFDIIGDSLIFHRKLFYYDTPSQSSLKRKHRIYPSSIINYEKDKYLQK